MKVICQGSELSDALSKVIRALPVKKTTPILDGVKISAAGDTLTLFATDAELSIEKKINAEVLIEGDFVVPGKLFAEYARKLENERLELAVNDGKKLVIKYLDSVLNINGYGADEYPVFKDVSKERSFVIMKKELKVLPFGQERLYRRRVFGRVPSRALQKDDQKQRRDRKHRRARKEPS